ncbi:MAG TPA: hypothetical protein VFX65_02290 [Candidatus Limnocylindrales bacterium]|nr:hypothetical protein [Candidatus Limnocylindrales bacterium]
MTNTQQISINHMELAKGIATMHGWTEQTQLVVRARIREREVEAASERLAATARTTTPRSLRRSVGRLLILTGRRVAGEVAPTASPAARSSHPARPIAA